MSDLRAWNLEPGQTVGGYTLISRLGAGAMGSVWKATDGGGQVYAMKILRDSLSTPQDPQDEEERRDRLTARERLRREAMALRRIRHPGVCAIVDMELDDTLAFIVTELIEGRNLRDDVAANGRYEGEDLRLLADKLDDAVRAVHAAGIVHRDIKPTNVMISTRGPVLVDFGISMGEGESHVTRTGLVMGTPGFIAPEIIEGAESDETTDWWSVASVLAFAATGRPVFGSTPMMAVLEREASGNANLAGLPPRTMAAFRAALDPDRSRRGTPERLLHAIALDAPDPFGAGDGDGPQGQTGQTGPAGQPGGDQVVRPFDPSNPRTMWTSPPSGVGSAGGRSARDGFTRALDAEGTRPLTGAAAEDSTVAMPPTPPASPIPPADATVAMPPAPPTAATVAAQPIPSMDATVAVAAESPGETTVVLPPSPPAIVPSAGGQPGTVPAFLRTETSPAELMAARRRLDALRESPVAEPPNPADVRRDRYLKRGILPLVALAVLPAAAGMMWPLFAPPVVLLLLWLLLTVGCNVEGQLEREAKRSGMRKRHDILLRMAALPWHALKALLLALPRTLLMTVTYAVWIVALTLALQLPWHMAPTPDLWAYGLPVFDDGPLSAAGAVGAAGAAVCWLLVAFWPAARLIRLGAGAMRRLPPSQAIPTA